MRLFVAIDLPDPVKDHLVSLKADIPTARWSDRHQMHLTLFFIGETERIAEVRAALAAVEAPPFELSLSGVGRFPASDRQPPRVLWAGVDVSPALAALHRQITNTLTALGFAADERPFSPHITLARLKASRPLPAASAFLNEQRGLQVGPAAVTEFVLFSSTLSPQGARYTRQAVYALNQA